MTDKEQLEYEIAQLKHELSVTLPHEMQEAASRGDLGENSEFSEIASRQNFAGTRLMQLVDRLSVYSPVNLRAISRDSVGMGSMVTVENVDTNITSVFKLVITEISNNIAAEYTEITVNSPIGKSLLNKHIGDTVVINTPSGKVTYKILTLITIHDV
jgi:transcription elongation factor GreA